VRPDPTSIYNLYGFLPWGASRSWDSSGTVFIGILPLLLGISMFLAAKKLNPAPTIPLNRLILRLDCLGVFMLCSAGFASGLGCLLDSKQHDHLYANNI